MDSHLPKQIKQKIDAIANDFESSWHEDKFRQLGELLKQIDQEYQDALLQEVLYIDLELKQARGLSINVEDYESLGDTAKKIVKTISGS